MQKTLKKSDTKLKPKEMEEASTTSRKQDDIKKNVYNTPRNYIRTPSTGDIYAQKKKTVQSVNAPKKAPIKSQIGNNVSPMKDFLKSSPSSVSQLSVRSRNTPKKLEAKVTSSARKETGKTGKDLPYLNVTVNSPPEKRKVIKEIAKEKRPENANDRNKDKSKEISIERQRTKTRTLMEDEVKILTPDVVDNNAEMLNLTHKLSAKPKAFYVDLDGNESQIHNKPSDEEVSYEDDFESYESDFDSYHSEKSNDDDELPIDENQQNSDQYVAIEEVDNEKPREETNDNGYKEIKDEEKMLDSGNFDLREAQRSANKTKAAVMDFIQEGREEDDKRISLTDEGFQDMSSSSAVSSMKTVHVDVLDRPLFIDFKTSKKNKRKRRLSEQMKQRATDILSMVTLHQMSYSLFEMKPIPYDLFMVTFGRSNYTQIATQTFDDGITEEIQTDDISIENKWTQNPVEFSKHDIYLNSVDNIHKYNRNNENSLTKFSFLYTHDTKELLNNRINLDKDYKENPLRIYFEQKDGVGSCEMLPYENYKLKLGSNEYNLDRLKKFLKKVESRISFVLSINSGISHLTGLISNTKLPFSKGYLSISHNLLDEKYTFLKHAKVTNLVISETKSNLIMVIFEKSSSSSLSQKTTICLWDLSVAIKEPVKILTAIENVSIGRFRGNTDGIFVAALEDGSIHLWDLSEEAIWHNDVGSEEKSTELVEINSDKLTQTEKDREWNLRNSNVGFSQNSLPCMLQASSFTSSAVNVHNNNMTDCIVGLEFASFMTNTYHEGGKRFIGKVCSLQRIGILTIWILTQEKKPTQVTGKAYWSKTKLESNQIINLFNHIDIPTIEHIENESTFNLNAAKRRLQTKKQERSVTNTVRPKSGSKFKFDRPINAASGKNKKVLPEYWNNSLVCNDLKVVSLNSIDSYLIARNNGKVMWCKREIGENKIHKILVATDTSSITSLEVSPFGLPYFLAASDSGTVNLCSILEARVLLTLDCRNIPAQDVEKYHVDSKGRYSGTILKTSTATAGNQVSIKSIHWSRVNPCVIFTLLQTGTIVSWDLTHSDIYAKSVSEKIARTLSTDEQNLTLLTMDGEIQVHRLVNEKNMNYLDIFQKYLALL